MRTKTPQQIYDQADKLVIAIAKIHWDGKRFLDRPEMCRKIDKVHRAFERYVDNIYALHTDNRKGLSVEESNHIWNNAATPVINYINR